MLNAIVQSLEFILSLCPCESERLHAVSIKDKDGRNALHRAAEAGDAECIAVVLSLYPEEERLRAVRTPDEYGETVLHWAASSGDLKCTTLLLSLYPESERLRAVSMQQKDTVLHRASSSGNPELIKQILAMYSEGECLNAVTEKCSIGTALHWAAESFWLRFQNQNVCKC